MKSGCKKVPQFVLAWSIGAGIMWKGLEGGQTWYSVLSNTQIQMHKYTNTNSKRHHVERIGGREEQVPELSAHLHTCYKPLTRMSANVQIFNTSLRNPLSVVAIPEMQGFIKEKMLLLRNSFQPKSLQLNSSQLIVGPGFCSWVQMANVARSFAAGSLSLSWCDPLHWMHEEGALRLRARYYTSMQRLDITSSPPST